MANQQLVEYVKQQIQLGVPKEAIKQTLVTSGWPDGEIGDAFTALTGGAAQPAAPAVQPAQTAPAQAAAHPVTSDIFQPKTEAQPAKKMETSPFQAKIETRSPVQVAVAAASMASGRSWKSFLLPGGMGLVIIGLGVWAFSLYSQNATLTQDVSRKTLSNDDLTRQLAAATQDKSNLNTDLTSRNDAIADLTNHVALLVPGTSTVVFTMKGTVKGDDKTPYTLTTDRNLVLTIKNYKVAYVLSALKPLVGTSAVMTGTSVPGSREITINSVNGTTLEEPAPAPASTTKPTASTTGTTASSTLNPEKPIVP